MFFSKTGLQNSSELNLSIMNQGFFSEFQGAVQRNMLKENRVANFCRQFEVEPAKTDREYLEKLVNVSEYIWTNYDDLLKIYNGKFSYKFENL